jgi:signal peptidase I
VNQFTQEALDFLKDIIIIVVIVVVIRTFLVMPFQINGQSMYESYYNKEFILVDRFSYRELPFFGQTQEIERWDVVIFAPGVSKERKYFIKRAIGLPGETVKIEDGRVYIQEVWQEEFYELEEWAYLSDENNKKTYVSSSDGANVYKVPENRYFVMGDNRNHSTDSRTCFSSCSIRGNYINPEEITGKLLIDLGYFDFSSFSFFHPNLEIPTTPRFFSSPWEYSY